MSHTEKFSDACSSLNHYAMITGFAHKPVYMALETLDTSHGDDEGLLVVAHNDPKEAIRLIREWGKTKDYIDGVG